MSAREVWRGARPQVVPMLATLVVSLALLPLGCRSGSGLNQSKAEGAIESWADAHHHPPHSIHVVGVRDEPQTNSAEADLAFERFPILLTVGVARQPDEYTGAGSAHFVRYTDGRWVLKRIEYGKDLWGGPYVADDINVEARDVATKAPTATLPDSPNAREAFAKIERARWMLANQRPLDMAGFVALLDDAVKLTPTVMQPVAAVWRRWAILFDGHEIQPEQMAVALNRAVSLDPSLAADDTMRMISSKRQVSGPHHVRHVTYPGQNP